MGLIRTAAYLSVCHCGSHARVIFSDGTKSATFATIAKGRDIVRMLKSIGKISDEEFKAINEQIGRTDLVESNDSIDSDVEALALFNSALGIDCLFGTQELQENVC